VFYSAQIKADYQRFVRTFGALMDIAEFTRLFFERAEGVSRAKVPKAMEDAFRSPHTEAEREIKVLIDQFNADLATKLEQDLFKQRKRLADAERTLQTRVTKAATESQRIATGKIAWARGKLDDIQRTEPLPRDSRIFPGYYAPVMVIEDGQGPAVLRASTCGVVINPANIGGGGVGAAVRISVSVEQDRDFEVTSE
jgi:hypothetical protein